MKKIPLYLLIITSLFILKTTPTFAGCLFNIADLNESALRTCIHNNDSVAFVTGPNNTFAPVKRALEIIAAEKPGMLVELRFFSDYPWTTSQIKSIVAASQSVNIGRPIIIRPYNEWLDDYMWRGVIPSEKQGGIDIDARIRVFYQGMEQFRQAIQASGNNLILADMLDYHRFSVDQYHDFLNRFQQITGQPYYGYLSRMNGVVGLNGYWSADRSNNQVNFGFLGNIPLTEILSRMPPGTKWRFSEFGYVFPGGMPEYNSPQIMQNAVLGLVAWLANNPQYAATFTGFNIFTKDPHSSASLGADFIASLASSNPTLLAIIERFLNSDINEPFNQAAFLQWIQRLVAEGQLVECKNPDGAVIGYAPTLEECASHFEMPRMIEDTTTCSTADQGPLRPYAYSQSCKKPANVPGSTKAFATTFTVITQKDFDIEDVNANKIECDDKIYAKFSWGALISEDYTKTETPWVGFGKSLDEPLSESKYLADYLEGTLYYDGNISQPENFWSETGVVRKLFPEWYQDKLKCDFIKNSKRDYQVSINIERRCADIFCWIFSPATLSKNLKSIKCPPIDTTERANTWDYTDDFYLWPVVPMFTREDTPSQVTLTAQHPPGKLTGITEGFVNSGINKVTHTLSVPHVERVVNFSKTLYNLMLPAGLQSRSIITDNENPETPKLTIIASSNTNQAYTTSQSLPSASLLSVNDSSGGIPTDDDCGIIIDPNNDFFVKSYNPKRNECGIIADPNYLRVSYSIDGEAEQVACEHNANIAGEWGRTGDGNIYPINVSELFDGQPCRYRGPVPKNSFTVNITLRNATGSWSCGDINMTNTLTKDENGNWIATCGTIPPPPPPPVCGYLGNKVGNINIQGRLDPKDPDKLDNVRNEPLQQNLENIDAVPTNPMRTAGFSDKLRECRECRDRPGYHDCSRQCRVTFNYETEISSTLLLPYLEKIQKYTAKSDQSGFLNIIRSASLSGFKTAHSKTNVEYYAENGRDLINGGSLNVQVNPGSGYVEFPFLQGVYDAQACVSQRLLLPANFAANVPCPLPITPTITPTPTP